MKSRNICCRWLVPVWMVWKHKYKLKLRRSFQSRTKSSKKILQTFARARCGALQAISILGNLNQLILNSSLISIFRTLWMYLVIQLSVASNLVYNKRTLNQWGQSFCRPMKRQMPNSSNNFTIHSTKERSHVITSLGIVLLDFWCRQKSFIKIFSKKKIPDTNQLASYTKMYEPIHAELANLMRAVPDQLRNLNEATVSMCTQRVTGEINKDIKVMQANLLKTLKENIKMEVRCVCFSKLPNCFAVNTKSS